MISHESNPHRNTHCTSGDSKHHLDSRMYCAEPEGEDRKLHQRVLTVYTSCIVCCLCPCPVLGSGYFCPGVANLGSCQTLWLDQLNNERFPWVYLPKYVAFHTKSEQPFKCRTMRQSGTTCCNMQIDFERGLYRTCDVQLRHSEFALPRLVHNPRTASPFSASCM